MHPVFKQLDPEAIRRVQQGIKPNAIAKPLKRQALKREGSTYRAARRNAALHGDVHTTWKGAVAVYVPYAPSSYRIVETRFSRTAVPAKTYKPNGGREVARRKRQREAREALS